MTRAPKSQDAVAGQSIDGATADQHARKLTHGQRYMLEEELRARHGKRQGQRTDLQGAAAPQDDLGGSPAKSGRALKTVEEVAKRAGQRPNAVAQRQLVFGSSLASPLLMTLVNDGRIPISSAATMVRALKMECDKLDDPAALQQAKAKLDSQVRQLVADKGDGKRPVKRKKKVPTSAARKQAPPAPARHPKADAMKSAQQRREMLQEGIFTTAFFDSLECAAEDWMAFAMDLQRRIGRDASDRSMRMLPEVQAGRDPRELPPIMPPALKRLLELHEVISKRLMPIVKGEVRQLMVEFLEHLGPVQEELAPESLPPGAEVPS
jgi:hypothetical protein